MMDAVHARSDQNLIQEPLAVGGGFDYVEGRLGLRHARTLIVPGHFDYQNQALLYVPQHLPDPRNGAFTAAAAEEIRRILKHSRGRAFVLFTSYQQMRLIYDGVSLEATDDLSWSRLSPVKKYSPATRSMMMSGRTLAVCARSGGRAALAIPNGRRRFHGGKSTGNLDRAFR